MKFIKYIDFSVQTLMFVAVLAIVIGQIGGTDAILLVLWMQLLVGPWQVVSALISVGLRRRMYKVKAVHLVLSGIYLTGLCISPVWQLSQSATLIILMAPAWTLAVFYYVITILATFQGPTRQSSFLPHTSF